MKNPYQVGCYALAVALITVVAAVFLSVLTEGLPERADKAFGIINAISALLQAVAAVVVGWLAINGYNIWKKQILHTKALEVIWSVKRALSNVKSEFQTLQIQLMLEGFLGDRNNLKPYYEAQSIFPAIQALKESLVSMDQIVEKDGYAWVTTGLFIENHIFDYLRKTVDLPKSSDPKYMEYLTSGGLQELSEIGLIFLKEVNLMRSKILKYEIHYSA